MMNKMMNNKDERRTLLDVVVDYTYALDTLDNYDYQRLTIDKTTKQETFHATYENAMEAIRKQNGRKGCDGKGCGELNQSEELNLQTIWNR